MKFTSVVFVHYASNPERSKMMRKSIDSLLKSTSLPFELIVVDNGGSIDDSIFLLGKTDRGEINTYIRNDNNRHFSFARNQAIRMSNGDYIAIVDNDILYDKGWLEECISVLEKYPHERIYATPVYNVAHWRPKYWLKETLEVNGKTFRQNRRAGSNCFVIRREDLQEIGDFYIHRIAGTKWTDRAWSLGYHAAVTEEVMVKDQGFRKGYNLNDALPVKLHLHNCDVYFNEDEFRVKNPDLTYIKQKTWIKE
jgi:glycosyltransferase involved in cell wall biosynthesis